MANILVLARSAAEVDTIQRLLGNDHNFTLRYPALVPADTPPEDALQAAAENIKEALQDLFVEGHVSTTLTGSLLAAMSAPKLRAPSLESLYLCINRYYCRHYVTRGLSPLSALLETENGLLSAADAAAALDKVPGGAVVRDVMMDTHATEQVVTWPKQVARKAEVEMERAQRRLAEFSAVLECLNEERYPLSQTPQLILEQWLDPLNPHLSHHLVELCVSDGEVVPWAISDVIYRRKNDVMLRSLHVLSSLPASDQFQVWAVVREAVQPLIENGFNHHFLHIDVVLTPENSVIIRELYPGICTQTAALYKHVFSGGESVNASMYLSMGKQVHQPKPLRYRHSMFTTVSLLKAGPIANALKVKVASETPVKGLNLLVKEGREVEEKEIGASGFPCATVTINGATVEECQHQCVEVLGTILINPF